MEVLKQRMYHLTMYNLSDKQKGIQPYHSAMEYVVKFVLDQKITPEFDQWIRNDKTVIILNGGTSNRSGTNEYNGEESFGSMEVHEQKLYWEGIPYAHFYEPDLNNSLSAIAFLVDERVWDKEKYPDPSTEYIQNTLNGERPTYEATSKIIFDYFTSVYGSKVAFLRTWLKQFKWA